MGMDVVCMDELGYRVRVWTEGGCLERRLGLEKVRQVDAA